MLQQTATLSSVNYGVSTHTIMTMGWDSFWKSHQCFRNFRRYSWNICNCMIIKEIYCKIAGAQKIWYISNSERFSTHYWLDLLAIKPNFTQNTELNLPLKLTMGPKCIWNCICILLCTSAFDYNLVFCYQNCSDLLWEKIVLVIEKIFWNSRLKAENLQNFWDH